MLEYIMPKFLQLTRGWKYFFVHFNTVLDVEKEREAELEKIRKEKEEQSALKNTMSSGAKERLKSDFRLFLTLPRQQAYLLRLGAEGSNKEIFVFLTF